MHRPPETLIADNVPFDSIKMRWFAAEYGFTKNTSSSNGQSERMIGTIKQLMLTAQEENRDPHLAFVTRQLLVCHILQPNYS